MNYENIRTEVLQAIKKANALGLIHGTSGNISMRDEDEKVVAITPSGIEYDTMTAEDIVIVDFCGKRLEGHYIPSSEAPMHTAVYRNRSDIRAIVHTHSLFATVMSMRRCELPRATVPSNMYYPIRTALFEMPGSDELAKAAVEALGDDGDVILLQNHGLLASGQSMDAAMTAAIYAEECAEVGYYAILANMPQDSYIPESAAMKIRQTALSGKAV